jgi:tRNA pseudouridine38-40 synthase
MRNIRLSMAYDGTDFCGWQRQPDRPSIQGSVECALQQIVGVRVKVVGSGRTDAGVHASNQVANFRTESPVPLENLQEAVNGLLPPTIRVLKVEEAAEDFHARRSVRAKTYHYRILQAPVCSPFLSRFVFHCPFTLDRLQMAQAASHLEGEHDFTSFAATPVPHPKLAQAEAQPGSRQKGAVRRIFSARVFLRPRLSLLIFEIEGNGFLHHMVRNIAGTLIEVGRGKICPGEISRILEARDRKAAGPTAPAQGLCLVKVEYDSDPVQRSGRQQRHQFTA